MLFLIQMLVWVSVAKLLNILGIAVEKGQKCAKWLSIKAFMKPNGANGKIGVTQRKAEY